MSMITKKSLSTFHLAYRIFGSTVIIGAISFLMFITTTAVTDNFWVNVVVSALLIITYYTMCYNDAYLCGISDILPVAKHKPYPGKGIAAGTIVYIIPLILLFMETETYKIWYNIYMITFKGVYVIFDYSPIVSWITLVIMPAVCGIGYRNGVKRNNIFDKMLRFKNKVVYEQKKQ